MNKPFSVLVNETEQGIVEIINKSGLPAYCIKTILNNMLIQVSNIEQQEIKAYQEEQRKESEKNDKKSKK